MHHVSLFVVSHFYFVLVLLADQHIQFFQSGLLLLVRAAVGLFAAAKQPTALGARRLHAAGGGCVGMTGRSRRAVVFFFKGTARTPSSVWVQTHSVTVFVGMIMWVGQVGRCGAKYRIVGPLGDSFVQSTCCWTGSAYRANSTDGNLWVQSISNPVTLVVSHSGYSIKILLVVVGCGISVFWNIADIVIVIFL